MRIWHILVGILVFTGVVAGMTSFGSGGLLNDMATYNTDVNVSKFTTYNYYDDVKEVSNDIEVNSTGGVYGQGDTEQTALSTLWDAAKTSTKSFFTGTKVVNEVQAEFGLPNIIGLILITILSLFVAFKAVEFIFGR